jgi:hypothetical protein
LVVGVHRHLGAGHRFTLAGERFVGLVAEDIAEVGDRGVESGVPTRVISVSANLLMVAALIAHRLAFDRMHRPSCPAARR